MLREYPVRAGRQGINYRQGPESQQGLYLKLGSYGAKVDPGQQPSNRGYKPT